MSEACLLCLCVIERRALNRNGPLILLRTFQQFLCTCTLISCLSTFLILSHCPYHENACRNLYTCRCLSSRSTRSRPVQSPASRDPKPPTASRNREPNPLREIHTRKLDPVRVYHKAHQHSLQRQVHAFAQSMACGIKWDLSIFWDTRSQRNLPRPVLHSHSDQSRAVLQRDLEIQQSRRCMSRTVNLSDAL